MASDYCNFPVKLCRLSWSLHFTSLAESSGNTISEESDTDLQPPPPKRQHLSDLQVKNHHLGLIKWKDDNGAIKELKIYSKIAHKWDVIANRLGLEPGQVKSIRSNNYDDHNRVTDVLSHWFYNARGLPNAKNYPKSWDGLINLVNDAELSEVAEELHTALSSTHNSVRGNLPENYM